MLLKAHLRKGGRVAQQRDKEHSKRDKGGQRCTHTHTHTRAGRFSAGTSSPLPPAHDLDRRLAPQAAGRQAKVLTVRSRQSAFEFQDPPFSDTHPPTQHTRHSLMHLIVHAGIPPHLASKKVCMCRHEAPRAVQPCSGLPATRRHRRPPGSVCTLSKSRTRSLVRAVRRQRCQQQLPLHQHCQQQRRPRR